MVKKLKLYRLFSFLILAMVTQGCVEPIEFETENFEDLLVIDATITNKLQIQEVELSKTILLEEEGFATESNAQVILQDDLGNELVFEENEPGIYRSVEEFQALPERNYQLSITRSNGKSYISEATTLELVSEMEDIRASRTRYQDEDGIAIQIDNFADGQETSGFYKFEYEETYKIVSRFIAYFNLAYINGEFVQVRKTEEETTCYNTINSTEIILANTNEFTENNLENFLVNFIKSDNPKLGRRYSILIKQYALSIDAFSYYTTLNNITESDNLFSQNQPGFVEGNIRSLDNPEEKVIGFFNVSSVVEKRVYFNFEDFYDQNDARPYFGTDCDPYVYSGQPDELIFLLDGYVKFLGTEPGGYRLVKTECVDCNYFGSPEVPDFWEE